MIKNIIWNITKPFAKSVFGTKSPKPTDEVIVMAKYKGSIFDLNSIGFPPK
jgi:hypothetical protein